MLGMKKHFDISDSIEIREVDIAGVACMLKIMKIRQESYGSLNFHVNKIFKLSVMNLDHMMEVGLQKKRKKEISTFLPTDLVSYFG